MLQFLTPIAFIALASLVVPVLIHLWSRGLGERVRVGSLRFVEETERRQLRTIRLSQLPLLLLRLALLVLLVGLLARPVWTGEGAEAGEEAQHWVLVHPEALATAALPQAYRTLDSLAADGATVRRLAPGFPLVDLDDAVPGNEAEPDAWSLLREADEMLPDGSVITVAGPGRLATFRGARPALRSSVEWLDLERPVLNRWLAKAQKIGPDSVQVTVGSSQPTGTRFARYLAAVSDDGSLLTDADGLALDTDGERVILRPTDAYPEDDALMMAPAAETLHVTVIHSLARRNDARYVAAALRAISGVTHRPLAITTIPETATLPEATAVLFWLNKAAPPETVVTRVQAGLVLVVDAEGEDWQDVQRRIFLEQEGSGVSGLLLKRRVDALYGGQARWKDSAGEPLLERFVSGAGVVYRFYSRFHPSSGAFVHTAAFPEGLWSLLFEGTAHTVSRSDRRRISAVQRMPVRRAERVFRESKPAPVRLHEPLWVLVFILFAVERWVAHRQSGG